MSPLLKSATMAYNLAAVAVRSRKTGLVRMSMGSLRPARRKSWSRNVGTAFGTPNTSRSAMMETPHSEMAALLSAKSRPAGSVQTISTAGT